MSELEDFLRQANVAVLATVDTKGRAHAAPVWYLYDDGEFIISTGNGSQKHRNVQAHPDVTLVVDTRVLPYYAVMARGSVTIGPALSPGDRLRLAVRYLGEERGERYVQGTSNEDAITLRLRPTKVITFDARSGR